MNAGRHVYVGNATADPTPCTVSSYFAPEDCADFFSLYTLKENQFVSMQQGWEGREGGRVSRSNSDGALHFGYQISPTLLKGRWR